ncbi:MAG: winged helix-turn-helix domain-containing protein [Candidatus Bipolaricaulia bacterium]
MEPAQVDDDDLGLGLKVKLFGPFEIWRGHEPISSQAWPQRKTQTLLKILLTERGRVFTQDQLIDALFPDLDLDQAAQNLYKRISELRRVLKPDLKRGADSFVLVRMALTMVCAVIGARDVRDWKGRWKGASVRQRLYE